MGDIVTILGHTDGSRTDLETGTEIFGHRLIFAGNIEAEVYEIKRLLNRRWFRTAWGR